MFQSTPPRGGRPRRCRPLSWRREFQSTPPRGGRRQQGQHLRLDWPCFNPRPRVGGDLETGACRQGRSVSIHAPAWGATVWKRVHAVRGEEFQSTPPRGGRLDRERRGPPRAGFQSTPPRGGRPHDPPQHLQLLLFQSTPPRGGRLAEIFVCFCRTQVSIHAPAWGATLAILHLGLSRRVSIHAPAWGATSLHRDLHSALRPVSIHAPAWGATRRTSENC